MKRKLLSLLSALLIIAMLLVSCGDANVGQELPTGDQNTTQAPNSESAPPATAPEEEEEPDEGPVVITENYLPAEVFRKMKVLFETGAGSFSAFATNAVPYAIRDVFTISNCRLKSISIPVYKTHALDNNGNFKITLYEVGNSYEDLKKPFRKTHTVLVNAEEYGLAPNTEVKRFIKVDLTAYDIVLDADETLAILSTSDTLIPGYVSNLAATNEAAVVMRRDFGVTGFLSKIGTADLNTHTTTLVFDYEMERTYETRAAYEAVLQAEADYQARLAAVREAYAGKNLSILGDSISTFTGVSNSAQTNSTIGGNAVWNTTNLNFNDYTDIYWGQLLEQVEMNLCVCNAWSGSRVYGYGNGQTTGIDNMLLRSSQLARNDGTTPDVILAYMGINDLHNGSPEGSLYSILTNGDTSKTQSEKVGEWFDGVLAKAQKTNGVVIGSTYAGWEEAYALSINNMLINYGDAEIYCFTLMKNYNSLCTDEKLERFNTCIRAIVEYFGVGLIDQQAGIITEDNFFTYGGDKTALHPSAMGHAAIARHIVNTLYANLED